MPSNKTWIVVSSGTEPLEDITRQLKQKGFTIQSSLDAIGQIVAQGSDEQGKEAKQIKGIASITPSHEDIDIGPPGSDTTW